MGLKNWRWPLNLHQHDNRGRNRHRNRRMHRNAQRAMVGVGIHRMNVRHLYNGQKCKQNKTHQGRYRQSSKFGVGLRAAISTQICLKFCQHTIPYFKNTQYWID
jgi:hypothetical protein